MRNRKIRKMRISHLRKHGTKRVKENKESNRYDLSEKTEREAMRPMTRVRIRTLITTSEIDAWRMVIRILSIIRPPIRNTITIPNVSNAPIAKPWEFSFIHHCIFSCCISWDSAEEFHPLFSTWDLLTTSPRFFQCSEIIISPFTILQPCLRLIAICFFIYFYLP